MNLVQAIVGLSRVCKTVRVQNDPSPVCADPHIVQYALTEVIARTVSHPVTITECARLSGGMDNFVYSISLSGDDIPGGWPAKMVLRIRPSASGYEHLVGESAIQQRCCELGYSAARVLATIAPTEWSLGHPAQLTAFATGTNLLDAIKTMPRQLRSLMRSLATKHVELHRLDAHSFDSLPPRRTIAEHRLGDVEREIARGHTALAKSLERVRVALEQQTMNTGDFSVCHGDFHPLNVLVDLQGSVDTMTVVDWTDATLDDRHADLARAVTLLRVAAIAAGSKVERVGLRILGPILAHIYLRAYISLREVDQDRLRAFEAVHLLSGLAQIASLSNPGVESASAGQTFHPSVMKSLRRRLDRTLRSFE